MLQLDRYRLLTDVVSILNSSEELSISIEALKNKTGGEVQELISLLELLESSKVVSFLGKKDISGKIILSGSYLDEYNLRLHGETLKTKSIVERRRQERGFISYEDYSLSKVKGQFYEALREKFSLNSKNDLDISFVDNSKFSGHISLRIPSLLQNQKERAKKLHARRCSRNS